MAWRLSGVAVSAGAVIGPALIRAAHRASLKRSITNVEGELERLDAAIAQARNELADAAAGLRRQMSEAAFVFDAHLLMHDDQMLVEAARARIREEHVNAGWAVESVARDLARTLASADHAYLRERAADIRQVGRNIVRALVGATEPKAPSAHVLIADELSPALALELLRGSEAVALVIEGGSASSHAALLGRSLGLPAVIGARGVLSQAKDGEPVLVDAFAGEVFGTPSDSQRRNAERQHARHVVQRTRLDRRGREPAVTRDGVAVAVGANLEFPEEARLAKEAGAEGVGLFRTEFLFLREGHTLDEEAQRAAYARVVEAELGPVIFRALDLGGDKVLGESAELRSTQLLLQRTDLLIPQLRAIMRACASRECRIMFPLIGTLDELHEARSHCNEVFATLARTREVPSQLLVGAMIEVPSAAYDAARLSRAADFVSIGTNDLIQYFFARSRAAERTAELAFEPVFLRFIQHVLESAEGEVAVCGDLACDATGAALLVGLGARRLSVPPPLVSSVRDAIRRFDLHEMQRRAEEALSLESAASVRRHFGSSD
ncbi:MAG: phosphoenolpyruvate--protein phosphotransferase [Myxococcota bacterium]